MKRIIAAALSILVGAFGYTIVDSVIEDRVATLESQVAELQGIVSSYHNNIIETTKAISSVATNVTTGRPSSTTQALTPLAKWLSENQVAGFIYQPDGDYFYTDDKETWQEGVGYNEFYDNYAPAAAMFIDQIRVRFTYENKDWMIQLWKGQYGWLFVGAETGIYTAPAGTYMGGVGDANHYTCPDREDWLYMQLDCYWSKNNDGHYRKIFTREYSEHWWSTGYVWGQLTKYSKPRTEIKSKNRITFKSEEMANLFSQGLREAGFVRSVAPDQLVDDSYYQSDKDVWLLWSSIQHDSFVGYTGTTLKTTTTTMTAEDYPAIALTSTYQSTTEVMHTLKPGITVIDEETTKRPYTTTKPSTTKKPAETSVSY